MMKRKFTLAGLLSIGICIALSSCVSNKELTTSRLQETGIPGRLKHLAADSLVSFMEDASGNIYVSVQGKLLFNPGSASIDLKGERALRPLGEMLYTADDFTLLIKGITDTVELNTKKYLTPWSLSEARAASIMSILLAAMRDKAEAEEAAEQKALAKKPSKAKNEAVTGQDNLPEVPVIPQQLDSTKYVVVLVNSL